jgi:hypothetical protein
MHRAAGAVAYLQDLANQQRFSGAVLMARRDEILISHGYGYGWAVVQAFDSRTSRYTDFAEHGGFMPGFAAHMRRYCYNGERATIIVLSNFERVAMPQIIADLQALLLEYQAEA